MWHLSVTDHKKKKKMQENACHNLIMRLNNLYHSSYDIKMLAKSKNLTLTLQSL